MSKKKKLKKLKVPVEFNDVLMQLSANERCIIQRNIRENILPSEKVTFAEAKLMLATDDQMIVKIHCRLGGLKVVHYTVVRRKGKILQLVPMEL